jgi:hypothetical protein
MKNSPNPEINSNTCRIVPPDAEYRVYLYVATPALWVQARDVHFYMRPEFTIAAPPGRAGDARFANIMAHGGRHLSTSTTVEVRKLSHPDFLIEIEVMAVIPELEAR